MSCYNCTRRTLGLFIRSFNTIEPVFASQQLKISAAQPSRYFSDIRRPYRADRAASESRKSDVIDIIEDDAPRTEPTRPSWQLQKAALKEKLGGEAWNPHKKLSPDTLEGIRHLNTTQPTKFTTPILAQHFKVSPEAIRRILKSKWRPSDKEYEARMQRWDKRGERIWTNLVEMGVKPPKKWRDMGVGRATDGERPKWKSRMRNTVDVRDSASDSFVVDDGDIIPIVNGSGKSRQVSSIPLAQRL